MDNNYRFNISFEGVEEKLRRLLPILEKTDKEASEVAETLIKGFDNAAKSADAIVKSSTNFDRVGRNISRITTNVKDLGKAETQLSAIQKDLNKQLEKYIAEGKDLTEVTREIKRVETALNSLADVQKINSSNVSDFGNNLSNAYRNAADDAKRAETINEALVANIRRLSNVSDDYETELRDLEKAYEDLNKAKRDFEFSGGSLDNGFDDGLNLINNRITEVRGNLEQMPSAADKANDGFGRLGKGVQFLQGAFKAFIALEIVQQILSYTSALSTAVDETRNFRNQVSQLTGLSETALDETTASVQALANTYGEDQLAILEAANATSNQLEISFTDALENIEDGLKNGANANGEYLDSLREYPTFIREAGGTFEDFNNILISSTQQGLFSDKGIDAVKEATIRLREFTKPTQDALKALGDEAFNEIQLRVENGQSLEAIKLISEGLNDTKLTATQTGAIIADVFGGAGEDAGLAYLQSLKDIDDATRNLTDEQKRFIAEQERTAAAQERLARANIDIANLLGESKKEFEQTALIVKSVFLSALVDLAGFTSDRFQPIIQRLNDAFSRIADALDIATEGTDGLSTATEILVTIGEALINGISFQIDLFSRLISGIASVIERYEFLQDAINQTFLAFETLFQTVEDLPRIIEASVVSASAFIDGFKTTVRNNINAILESFNRLRSVSVGDLLSGDFSISEILNPLNDIENAFDVAGKNASEAFNKEFEKGLNATELLERELLSLRNQAVNLELRGDTEGLKEVESRIAEIKNTLNDPLKLAVQTDAREIQELENRKIEIDTLLATDIADAQRDELLNELADIDAEIDIKLNSIDATNEIINLKTLIAELEQDISILTPLGVDTTEQQQQLTEAQNRLETLEAIEQAAANKSVEEEKQKQAQLTEEQKKAAEKRRQERLKQLEAFEKQEQDSSNTLIEIEKDLQDRLQTLRAQSTAIEISRATGEDRILLERQFAIEQTDIAEQQALDEIEVLINKRREALRLNLDAQVGSGDITQEQADTISVQQNVTFDEEQAQANLAIENFYELARQEIKRDSIDKLFQLGLEDIERQQRIDELNASQIQDATERQLALNQARIDAINAQLEDPSGFDAEQYARLAAERTAIEQDSLRLTTEAGLQSIEQQSELNVSRIDGQLEYLVQKGELIDDEVLIEKERTRLIQEENVRLLEAQLEYYDNLTAAQQAALGLSDAQLEIIKNNLKSQTDEAKKGLEESVKEINSAADAFDAILISVGINEGDVDKVKQVLGELANFAIEQYKAQTEAQIQEAERRIEDSDNEIDRLENRLEQENELKLAGLANESDATKKAIEDEQAAREKALEERERLEERQRRLDRIAQTAKLGVAVANFLAGTVKDPITLILAAAGVTALISLFNKAIGNIGSTNRGFNKGTDKLERQRGIKKGIDTIPAVLGGVEPIWLDEFERIVPAKNNLKNFDIYNTIQHNDNDAFPDVAKEYMKREGIDSTVISKQQYLNLIANSQPIREVGNVPQISFANDAPTLPAKTLQAGQNMQVISFDAVVEQLVMSNKLQQSISDNTAKRVEQEKTKTTTVPINDNTFLELETTDNGGKKSVLKRVPKESRY